MINPQTNLPEGAKTQTLVMCSYDDLKSIVNECLLMNQCKGESVEESKEFLTAEEAMAKLHCNRSTLWRWGKTEYLKPVKIGKKNLYREADVNKLLNK